MKTGLKVLFGFDLVIQFKIVWKKKIKDFSVYKEVLKFATIN